MNFIIIYNIRIVWAKQGVNLILLNLQRNFGLNEKENIFNKQYLLTHSSIS